MVQVITDKFLNEMTKALNEEEYVVPAFMAIGSSEVTSLNNDQGSLDGEYSNRIELTGSRADNQMTYSAIRLGNAVTGAEDDLVTSGLTVSSITDETDLMAGIIHNGVTQTSDFDIEFQWKITLDR